MRWCLVALFAAAGCAESGIQSPKKTYGLRDLGDHLGPIGEEDLAPSMQNALPDFSVAAGPDMAMPRDLAGADLSTLPDLTPSIVNEPPIYVNTATSLYKVDPTTYNLTFVGTFNAGENITDIAVKPDGNLLAISYNRFYEVDKNDASTDLLVWDEFDEMNALTCLSDGRILMADLAGDVYEIEYTKSGILVVFNFWLLGNYGASQTTAGDLTSVSNGTLWGLSKSGNGASGTSNGLMVVNNVTGVGTFKGLTGFGELWGSAYSKGRILGFSSTGQIIEINTTTGVGTLLKTHSAEFWGAASNPTVSP
jgi:hypothetical protein